MSKARILIVDDALINRAIIKRILSSDYDIVEARDGEEAISRIKSEAFDLVLLDIFMPRLTGYGVLEKMNILNLIEFTPVIMISQADDSKSVARAFDLGASDYIARPFEPIIVKKRVNNILRLHAKQKELRQMVSDQIEETERSQNILISVLGHVVEFRNAESGFHIFHIRLLTEKLLKALAVSTDKYDLSAGRIRQIAIASSLHDVGKIQIPAEILNKPGRLTPEEFAIVKTHTTIGAKILDSMPIFHDDPLVKEARDIARWHHEKYDGKGYPDGLVGEQIPISAQVVSVADVFDALVSKRCYKDALPLDKAVAMIMNGECGAFNPDLLAVFEENAQTLYDAITQEGATERFFSQSQSWRI